MAVLANIEAFDLHEYNFWLEHFEEAFEKTNDYAFKEIADSIKEHKYLVKMDMDDYDED